MKYMPLILQVFLIFIVALALSLVITPLARRLAPKIGAMDMPKERGVHKVPMPRLGGLAVYLASTIAMLVLLPINRNIQMAEGVIIREDKRLIWLIAAGTVMFLVGLIDDIKGLSPKMKLLGQTAAALILYFGGIRFAFISNPVTGGIINFPWPVSLIITVLWLVGITNAVNLIDGLDGLSSGVVLIASLSVAYVGYIHGWYLVCLILLALAGSAAGFLPYNFHPASIFLGDGGTLYLGFMLAATAIMNPMKSAALMAVIVPLMVLALPIFDTLYAIIRRAAHKQPIMQADKGHLHHRILATGLGQRRSVLILYSISAIMGIAAIIFSRNLYREALGLVCVAALMVSVFLVKDKHND